MIVVASLVCVCVKYTTLGANKVNLHCKVVWKVYLGILLWQTSYSVSILYNRYWSCANKFKSIVGV